MNGKSCLSVMATFKEYKASIILMLGTTSNHNASYLKYLYPRPYTTLPDHTLHSQTTHNEVLLLQF